MMVNSPIPTAKLDRYHPAGESRYQLRNCRKHITMVYLTRICVAIGVMALLGCALGGWSEKSVPLPTGHTREEISNGFITLHYDKASLMIAMNEELRSESETLVVAAVPIPMPSTETEKVRVQKTAKVTFWVSVQPKSDGIAFEPMKTALRTDKSKTIYPVGYVKEYYWLYSDILPLSADHNPVACSSNTEFNIVFDTRYDSSMNYDLTIEGLTAHGIPVSVHAIQFVRKRTHYAY